MVMFELSQPLLTLKVTLWLESDDSHQDIGRGLIGGTALLYLGLTIANVIFKRQLDRLTTKVRAILIATGHKKSLSISADDHVDGSALSLLNLDTARVCSAIPFVAELLSAPLEVFGAIAILEWQIGVSCVAPASLMVAFSVLGLLNLKESLPYQKQWLAAVQKRIAYTAAVLDCPKSFKMLGLSQSLGDHIQRLRVDELAQSATYRKFVTIRNALGWAPDNLAPVLALTVYALYQGSQAITPSKAFTTLSLVTLLSTPIHKSILGIPQALNALASIQRIQAFLAREDIESEEHDGNGRFRTPREQLSRSETTDIELSELSTNQRTLSTAITVQEATVCTHPGGKQILTDVSLHVQPATLVCVVGPVGSGKTTLLRAIIGDVRLNKGRIDMGNEGVAYCAQDPWLPNDTAKDIILSSTAFERDWYATVVQACALDRDFASFQYADATLIGSGGVSLSGGQQQRLALARALYSRKKVLVLDDVTSGLDANLTRQVVGNLKRFCHEHGLAVILATHAVRHLKYEDHVVALSNDGRVISQGPLAIVSSEVDYLRQLKLDMDDVHDGRPTNLNSVSATSVAPEVGAAETARPVDAGSARRTGDISVYKYYIASMGWKFASLILVTAVCFAFGTEFPQLWVRWWTEAVRTSEPMRPLGLWIGIYVFLGLVPIISVFGHLWVFLVWTIPKSSANLHQQLLNSVLNAPYSLFMNTEAGAILNRFANDMSLIEDSLAGGVVGTLLNGGICIGAAILICAGADYVGLAILFVVIVVYAIQKFYLRTSRQLRYLDLETQAPLVAHFQETIAGVTTIRAFGWQRQSHQRCLSLLDRSQQPFYLLLCIQRWLNLVLNFITAVIATILIAFAVTMRSTASSSSVGLSLLNILSFNSVLSSTIVAWTSLETSLSAVARCKAFVADTSSEHLDSEIHEPPSNWPSAGHLEISNVTAAYGVDRPVLQGISLSIPAGSKVGIFGRSGSGKSSLVLTLFRMLELSTGGIRIDDVDLSTVPRSLIRRRLTALPQDAFTLPNGSIRANLDPEGAHNLDDLDSALRKVGLWDLVHSRGGLDSEMSPSMFSQGQIQLFAVARVLLRPSAVIVVDEMTSALDEETETRVMGLIMSELKSSTVIAVAHRLRTVMDFDMLVGLQDGRIVECGSPKELVQKTEGYFKTTLDLT